MCSCGPVKPEDQPLITVDGMAISYDSLPRGINPNMIQAIEVYRGKKAARYGNKAVKNGVIVITTKKGL
ncbi:TonB-dependent receptor [uncultured Fibrella sp.]|uniref:TonB-dependent receptor n=1 Tax=uncultured Fibrella sp. TaxID=1284596 RepID=UPI0035C9CBAC